MNGGEAMETLGDFVQSVAEQFGPRPALLHKPGKTTVVWSYTELKERANRVARWLREQGVRKGDRIILWVPNSREFKVVSLLPLSHSFEQTVGLLLALKRGTSVYYISSLMPATIFDALKEHGATAMLLVPGALQLFMSSIEREAAKQGK